MIKIKTCYTETATDEEIQSPQEEKKEKEINPNPAGY